MNSSSIQTVSAVQIIANQLCVLQSYSTYMCIFLLTIVIISTVLFAFQVYNTFYSIIRLYATVSAYCSDPRGYGSRYLLSMTFIIGYLLVILCIEEQQIRIVKKLSLTDRQTLKFYLQLIVNLCFPLLAICYVRGKGLLQNQYYRLGVGLKLPIIMSECVHYLSAISWLFIMIFYNTTFAFRYYFVATATREKETIGAMIYLISSIIIILSCLCWLGSVPILTLYEEDFDDNLTYYCPDCTSNDVYKSEQSFFKLTEPIDTNACHRCLRSTPTHVGSLNVIDGNNQLHVPISYQEKIEGSKSAIIHWLRLHIFLQTIQYKTYTHLHVYGFILESIAFFGTALLAVIGSILRKRDLCEQIGFAF